jgi:hypothetical protein
MKKERGGGRASLLTYKWEYPLAAGSIKQIQKDSGRGGDLFGVAMVE